MSEARKKIAVIEKYIIDRRDRADTRKHLLEIMHSILFQLELENEAQLSALNTLYNYIWELRQEIAKVEGRRKKHE
jgi:hypothetical protein